MIPRDIDVQKLLKPGKVLIIYGPRQVGKTTLIKAFLENTLLSYRYDTGDNILVASELSKCTYQSTDEHVGNYDLIVIDEAQKIMNIGRALKLMVDRYPSRFFIATGSSSFELANKTGEALTGRKRLVYLYPISHYELSKIYAPSELKANLESYLIYGLYPEVVEAKSFKEKQEIISLIAHSYLYKDILEFESIKKSDFIFKLLKLLALQVGSLVSHSELAASLGVDVKTVVHYLDLLVKSFVLFPLSGYASNLRKEVSKMKKYYFYDVGVRNAILSNFNHLSTRDDVGALWENFLIMERIKQNSYRGVMANYYFWRTYSQQEVDFIEERGGRLYGFEMKWSPRKRLRSKGFRKRYPKATVKVVNPDNYLHLIS